LGFCSAAAGAHFWHVPPALCRPSPGGGACSGGAARGAAGRGRPPISEILFLPPQAGAEERERAERALRRLDNAMFGVLIADWAVNDLLGELGLRPDALAGHSMGELAALFATGCLDETPSRLGGVVHALEELQRREDEGDSEGAVLLAVGAGRETVAELIHQKAGGAAYLAMDNCPHQSVAVGPAGPMAAVEAELQARRI